MAAKKLYIQHYNTQLERGIFAAKVVVVVVVVVAAPHINRACHSQAHPTTKRPPRNRSAHLRLRLSLSLDRLELLLLTHSYSPASKRLDSSSKLQHPYSFRHHRSRTTLRSNSPFRCRGIFHQMWTLGRETLPTDTKM